MSEERKNTVVDILSGLYLVSRLIPSVIEIVEHYKTIMKAGEIKPEDKERAKRLLEGARWEKWE